MKAIVLVIALMFVGCASSKIPIKVRVPDDVINQSQLRVVNSCKFGCNVYDTNLKDVGSWGFMALKSHWTAYAKDACINRCEIIPFMEIYRSGGNVQEIK